MSIMRHLVFAILFGVLAAALWESISLLPQADIASLPPDLLRLALNVILSVLAISVIVSVAMRMVVLAILDRVPAPGGAREEVNWLRLWLLHALFYLSTGVAVIVWQGNPEPFAFAKLVAAVIIAALSCAAVDRISR
jgi:nucleoside recognition membrane protein YjiH